MTCIYNRDLRNVEGQGRLPSELELKLRRKG